MSQADVIQQFRLGFKALDQQVKSGNSDVKRHTT